MADYNSKYHAMIMAGGIGSRFWPLSRNQKPKQFLDILGTGKTLIQMTFDRLNKIIPIENIWVVGHEDYKLLIKEQLPDLKPENILLEPLRKNTAPCILYAAKVLSARDPESIMFVAPSDHLIHNLPTFLQDLIDSFNFIDQNPNNLLTFGIKVSRPETGYGYIKFNSKEGLQKEFHSVIKFVEKPDHQTALAYMESGNFVWNSGMFMWKTSTILKNIEVYIPELYQQFEGFNLNSNILELYQACKSDSIDFALMEKANSVVVKTVDFGWSDLGTWGSLYELLSKDSNGNAVVSATAILQDTHSCMVHNEEDKLIAMQGLDDLIIINTKDALLICHKSQEQSIKQIVSSVSEKFGNSNI